MLGQPLALFLAIFHNFTNYILASTSKSKKKILSYLDHSSLGWELAGMSKFNLF